MDIQFENLQRLYILKLRGQNKAIELVLS